MTAAGPPAGPGRPGRAGPVAAAAVALVTIGVLALQTPAGATGDGSGSAGARGRGSTIISTILWGGSARARSNRDRDRPPPCTWRTLSDIELVFVLQVAASMPELQDAGLFRALEPWLIDGLAPGMELQVLHCDGVPRPDSVRARPAAAGASETATAARRQLLTRLPAPALEMSPPAGRPVLVNHPVFAWVQPRQWATPVTATLEAGGRTVEVEAVPTALDLVSGEADSGGRVVRCDGPGVAWDPASPSPVEVQASRSDACILRYSKATDVEGRRAAWTGYAQLYWRGHYRVDGGPWRPLGDLFSIRVFTRSVEEASTVIEQP